MTALSEQWHRWRRQRRAEMVQAGMPPETARIASAHEATHRAKAAKEIGYRAAAEALLSMEDDGINARFLLVIDPSLVEPARREAARRAIGAVWAH